MQTIDKLIFIAFSGGVEAWLFWICFCFFSYLLWEAFYSAVRLIASQKSKLRKIVSIALFIISLPLYLPRTFVKFFIWLATRVTRKMDNTEQIEDIVWRVKRRPDMKTTDLYKILFKVDVDMALIMVYLMCLSGIFLFKLVDRAEQKVQDVSFQHSAVAQALQDLNQMEQDVTEGGIVYITNSGTKYHQIDCWHLSDSGEAVNLSEAIVKGYEPCSKCY